MTVDRFTINGVQINFIDVDDVTPDEAKEYLKYVRQRAVNPAIKTIIVKGYDDGTVDVSYTAYGQKFERIRRVTGYLVGSLDRWNDAKQAEEKDRVKHDIKLLEE